MSEAPAIEQDSKNPEDTEADLLERALAGCLHRSRDGRYASLAGLVRRAVMLDLCPEVSSGYRWSATSNYASACLRAAKEGRPQPRSRGQLDETEQRRVWAVVERALALWHGLVTESGADNFDDRVLLERQLLRTGLGRRLFAVKPSPRARPSALAA